MNVLLTGADGPIGRYLVPHLRERHVLRLSWWDPGAPPGRPSWAAPGDDVRRADITDQAAVRDTMGGVDAVVHLAGERRETAGWEELAGPNVDGVRNVLEEAVRAGVGRVLLASSTQVTGGWDAGDPGTPAPAAPVRPDSLCAVTQVFGEALASLMADRWGLPVICLRLGQVARRPGSRPLSWLSPRDLCHLVDCGLAARVRSGVYYGISANTGAPWDLASAGRDLGYRPVDDAGRQLPGPARRAVTSAGRGRP